MQERGRRAEFASKVRIQTESEGELVEHYADNLSAGGMFVLSETPHPVGSKVLVEFLLPNEKALCRVVAEVVHSRAPRFAGDSGGGMGLRFVEVDPFGKKLMARTGITAADPDVIPPPRRIEALSHSPPKEPILGIDLGTVNSCVAIVQNGTPRVLTLSGYDTIPSAVYIPKTGQALMGNKALERLVLEPQRTIVGWKRFLGRRYTSRELKMHGAFFHYEFAADPRGNAAVRMDDLVLPLEWISSRMLIHLRQHASKALGQEVSRCVITVPAHFGDAERKSVEGAARLAGLRVERLLNEPTAAAVAFGFGRGVKRRVLVYDLGGGTFDATVLNIDDDKMEMVSTGGDAFLGGVDFDNRIVEFFLGEIQRQHGVDLHDDAQAVQRLRFAAELAKKQLSEATTATVDLPCLAMNDTGPLNVIARIDRPTFEQMTADLVTRSLRIMDDVLARAQLKGSDIDDVLLIGGQSRSRHVIEAVAQRFERKPGRNVHPDHAVALGAAIAAAAAYTKIG